MRRRGHGESLIRRIVYDNPLQLHEPKPALHAAK